MATMSDGVINALFAAILFGLSTPLAKIVIGEIKPFMLAGLLYTGSGAGLLIIMIFLKILKPDFMLGPPLKYTDLPWLAGAILSGGFLSPLFLMYGLFNTSAFTASLLLNLEGVFTALIAWFIFKENFDKKIMAGIIFITAGSVVLSYPSGEYPGFTSFTGPIFIITACFLWAADNNFTKKISGGDPFQISIIKGMTAGLTNLFISYYYMNISFPGYSSIIKSLITGFFGYGLSLLLFILALRQIGASRTGAYFSIAPFFGAIASIFIFKENPGCAFYISFILMAAGIYCHLSENHDHSHKHTYLCHEHVHSHDDMHHNHNHNYMRHSKFNYEYIEDNKIKNHVHSHFHEHQPVLHSHFHYPDIHHEHEHH